MCYTVRYVFVTFADSYPRANIEFRNKACTRGKYYSYTGVYLHVFVFIYVYRHIYMRHVLAVALASLPQLCLCTSQLGSACMDMQLRECARARARLRQLPPKITTCCDLKSARILKVVLKFSFGNYIFTICLFTNYIKVLLGFEIFLSVLFEIKRKVLDIKKIKVLKYKVLKLYKVR